MIATTVLATLLLAPARGMFANPVWNHNFPDPFIVRDGETYYAFATHNGPKGFQAMRSPNLVDWEALPPVGKPPWSDQQLWAPEIYPWRGRWAFFYSALNPATRKRDLAVAFGPRPTGPFSEHTTLVPGISENAGSDENGAIDPALFVEDGTPYLLYIREAPPRALKIVALSSDLRRTVGPATDLLLADRPIERGVLDAPTLIRRGGTYYLFYSGGWFQSYKRDASYKVWVAKSERLKGPYTKAAEPLLQTRPGQTYSPGHQSIFQTPAGEWWVAYHAWNAEGEPLYGRNPIGRSLRLDRLVWTARGPVIAGPSLSPQPRPRVGLPVGR